MFALIRLRIGVGGTPQQADSHDIVFDIMPILAIVEQTDTISTFT
jgi:hypothetical protein